MGYLNLIIYTVSFSEFYSLFKEDQNMSEMLNKWLEWSYRDPCPYAQFRVIDIQEQYVPDEEIKNFILKSLTYERFNYSFIHNMVRILGWDSITEEITENDPNDLSSFLKGDIGEVFFSVILREFHNYIIPVPKLRYKIITRQSQPRTDVLALKIDENRNINEVCYFEVKLRTGTDNTAATDSYSQLMDAYNSRTPSILKYVASILKERSDSLYDSFLSYLQERRDSRDNDNFQIGLCWEKVKWNEKVLESLDNIEIELPILSTQILQIANLKSLLNDIFNVYFKNEVLNHS